MPTTKKTGYYVSTTSWFVEGTELWEPKRYLDASEVPYSVVPALPNVTLGDYGLVIRNVTGASIPYVCGDSSGKKKGSTTLGECSGAVYLAMGSENEGDFSFIVFDRSHDGKPLNEPKAAESPVRIRLSKLSAEDADALATHLASKWVWGNIRGALTKWSAPPFVVDAISGA